MGRSSDLIVMEVVRPSSSPSPTSPLHELAAATDCYIRIVAHLLLVRSPIVTGTSVLALKFKDGVMVAADNLASYGSLARFKDVERLKPVGSYTVVGAGGDMSDFQHLERTLESLVINEGNQGDGHEVGPKEVYNYLSKLMYARRTKMNPLWNTLLVGGFRKGERCVSLPLVDIHCVPLTEPFACFTPLQVPRLRRSHRHNVHLLNIGNGLRSVHVSSASRSLVDLMKRQG